MFFSGGVFPTLQHGLPELLSRRVAGGTADAVGVPSRRLPFDLRGIRGNHGWLKNDLPPKIGWLRTLQSPKRCRKVSSSSKS